MVVSYVNAWPIRQAKCWSIFVCCQIAKFDDVHQMYHCYSILALMYVGKYWIVKIFANLMNDAQFVKIFPN